MSIYRNILVDKESAEAKLWNLKEDQVIQARLFPFHQDSASALFMTHLWIHPDLSSGQAVVQPGQAVVQPGEIVLQPADRCDRFAATQKEIQKAEARLGAQKLAR